MIVTINSTYEVENNLVMENRTPRNYFVKETKQGSIRWNMHNLKNWYLKDNGKPVHMNKLSVAAKKNSLLILLKLQSKYDKFRFQAKAR